jgi:hypothetical protein
MKKEFPGYYHPEKEDFEEIWETCNFVFDANILLNLYRYSRDTSIDFINILESKDLEDRIWIPYQAALEYHQNRLGVIYDQTNAYKKIQEKLSGFRNDIDNELSDICKKGRHPLINHEEFISELITLFEKYESQLDDLKEDHPDLLSEDWIKNKVTDIFEGKVCDQLDPKEKERIIKEGNNRYQIKIPPGYKDINKPYPEKYGDLFIWFEIINFANQAEKPVIFITDDRKEDWWYRHNGKTIGPRPELINEFISKTGRNFYMYSADRFMYEATNYLDKQINEESIEEIEDIRLQEENSQILRQNQEDYIDLLASKKMIDMMETARQAAMPQHMIDMVETARQAAMPQHMIDMMETARQAAMPQHMIDMMETARQAAMPQHMIDMMESARQAAMPQHMIDMVESARQAAMPQHMIDMMESATQDFEKYYSPRQSRIIKENDKTIEDDDEK